MTAKRKLIEVALPLEAINVASAREKSIRHGHPSTLHLWWARRPLAACRAVLFASLVDDPSSDPDRFPTEEAQETERQRLFGIIERLVLWENTTNEAVLEEARAEIRRSTNGDPPPVLDPFCGGGSIPLEAQRLGLTAYASDLNPVAVLITKALVEIPPKFRDMPPVHPDARRGVGGSGQWKGAAGLAEDVRRYGAWMRDEAERRIGHLYPKVKLPPEQGGGEATVIAWLWARTVKCPNPACGAEMPLVRSFELSRKPGKRAWIEPIVERDTKTVDFVVRTGSGAVPDGTVGRQGARCIVCGSSVPLEYARSESRAKRMKHALMAIVAEGRRGRVFLAAADRHAAVATSASPAWGPEEPLVDWPGHINVYRYGLTQFRDLFTPRQLVGLTSLTELVSEARARVRGDANRTIAAVLDGENDAAAYADAVATYLALGVSKLADSGNSLVSWKASMDQAIHLFTRQAIPMVWDFAEPSLFSSAMGDLEITLRTIARVLDQLPASTPGIVRQEDAAAPSIPAKRLLISTDPPYYDNIGYSDLADFFYVWLRPALRHVYPELFGTVLTPKSNEMVAMPYRFDGSSQLANAHFERSLGAAFSQIKAAADERLPVTIYYAYRQAESEGEGATIASTGWETMLQGLLESGLAVAGTWPMRTELANKVAMRNNMLASSIVLVCRPRPEDAGITTRKDFVAELKAELPGALKTLQHGNIAPVDLAQASIGPGMAVFSRYAKVLEPDGSPMRVRTALGLINQALDEILTEQEGEFDADTRWAIAWYEQHGMSEGPYGSAEVLSKAKDTSIAGLQFAGVVASGRGKVRLLKREELVADWDPAKDRRTPIWEATQRLVHLLMTGGETAAADMLVRLGGVSQVARDLAYRLYHVAERKGWTEDALAYNTLVVAWSDLQKGAEQVRTSQPVQAGLGLES